MASELDTAALLAKDVKLARHGSELGTKIKARVDSGFDDASAHAFRSLTQVIRDAAEGRPTVAAVRRSRSFQAGIGKLDDLHRKLVGILDEGRVDFYIIAYRGWCNALPSEYLRSAIGSPSASDVERFRVLLIGPLTIVQDVGSPISRAKLTLEQTLIMAGSRATAPNDAGDLIDGWSERARMGVLSNAQGILEDSLYRADYVAGRDCLKPELLHPDPTLDE